MSEILSQEVSSILKQLLGLMEQNGILDQALSPADYDKHLLDLHALTSLGSAEVVALVEEGFGVSIPEQMLQGELMTLNAIAAHIARLRMDDVA